MTVRLATTADAAAVAKIYNHYILNTVVTFELEEVSAAEISRRMQTVKSLSLPWIIAERHDELLGYAYASRWHQRGAFKHSAEVTVYLDPRHCGRGIGSRLLDRLLQLVGEQEIHTLIGGITLPNDASVSLHERFGFQKAAHYREVGYKFGRWIDVGYWQRMM